MDIELRAISIRELSEGYRDDQEGGVFGYSDQLDIRPPFQREFVYDDRDRAAVIDTVSKGFPLNVMYWAVREEGGYEVIDGQQRTISICQYVEGDFALSLFGKPEVRYFHNLQADEKDALLAYELTVYLCSGTPSEKLDWFRTINIAGRTLTDQERRNAVYSGPWVSDAKRYFSRQGGPAAGLGGDYLSGAVNRQEYLETVIGWASGGKIEDFMGKRQHDTDAKPLWNYFTDVIDWVTTTFPNYRKPMKGLPWGSLYNTHKGDELDPIALETRLSGLFADFEVENKRGIYVYLLTGEEKHLNLRQFDEPTKLAQYEKQVDETGLAVCPLCNEHFGYTEMAGDHVTAWSKGGKTVPENCQMLCYSDNIKKSNH